MMKKGKLLRIAEGLEETAKLLFLLRNENIRYLSTDEIEELRK